MVDMKLSRKTYKELYIKFAWKSCIFILTLCIAASVFQALENQDEASPRYRITKDEIISNFSSTFKISRKAVLELIYTIDDHHRHEKYQDSMTYREGLVLTMSLFYTIGWDHVTPITVGGKIFAVFISFVGIPLTLMIVLSGGKILAQLIFNVIRIIQIHNPSKLNRYSENKINQSSKQLLTPVLLIMYLIYVLLFTSLLEHMETFSYGDALWYSFTTLSTIGLGGYNEHTEKSVGFMTFLFFWILFGMIFLAAIVISILSSVKRIKLKSVPRRRTSANVNNNRLLDNNIEEIDNLEL